MKNRVIFLLYIVSWYAMALHAQQNNPFDIHDSVYAYYQKQRIYQRKPAGEAMCDTLFVIAKKYNDLKAQCIALNTKVEWTYYNKPDNIAELKRAVRNTREFVEKTPYTAYIFGSWNLLLNYHFVRGNYEEMQKELKDYQELAIKLNDCYGIARSYLRQGEIFLVGELYSQACTEFKKSIEYSISQGQTQDLAFPYSTLGICYLSLRDTVAAEEAFHKSLEVSLIPKQRREGVRSLLKISYLKGRWDDVDKYLLELHDLFSTEKGTTNQEETYYEGKARLAIHKGMYDQLHALKDSFHTVEGREWLNGEISRIEGNDSLYYEYLLRKSVRDDSLRGVSQMRLFKAFNLNFTGRMMEAQQEELKLHNMQMRVGLLHDQENDIRMQHVQDSLQMVASQTKLGIQKAEAELDRQREMQRKEQYDSSHQNEKNQVELRITILSVVGLILIALLGVALVVRIMTSRIKRQHEAALIAQKEAEDADKRKTRFLEDLNHEIRTPLNVIVGYTDILNMAEELGISDEERLSINKTIHKQSIHLRKLINNVLDLSKLESGTYVFTQDHVDVKVLANNIAQEIKERLQPGVEFIVDVPNDMPEVLTDKYRITQIMQKLSSNAAKHTVKGSITLSCRYSQTDAYNGIIKIAVTDTGTGIPEKDQEKIFDSFSKLDPFRDGFGLGLTICRVAVQLMGGRIRVDKEYTTGTRIVVEMGMNSVR